MSIVPLLAVHITCV